MEDEKGLLVFIVFFVGLVLASITLASIDEITPRVAEAQASVAIGGNSVMAIEKGMSILLKLLAGAAITGAFTAAFTTIRKEYRDWKRSARMGRWQAGPYARWQTRPEAPPKLRREDLMLLALSGRYPPDGLARRSPVRSTRAQPEPDELDIDL
jgi:hypothetical protein